MKTLLAILLGFIISEAPVLAIHGGYSLGGAQGATGTYAGVMVPTSATNLAGPGVSSGFGTNALGLFTLSIPETGIGGGTVYIFAGSQQMTGPIQALPDPNNVGGVVGVINATGQILLDQGNFGVFGNFTDYQETGQASGGFTATDVSAVVSNSPTGINLTGTANLSVATNVTGTDGITNLVPTVNIVFAVEGYQQSADASAVSGT